MRSIVARWSSRRFLAFVALGAVVPLMATAPAAAKDRRLKKLPAEYREWLEEVDVIMTGEERDAFLDLGEDRYRDAFIEGFWRARDPAPRSQVNEYRETYYERMERAAERFPDKGDDRVRYYMLYGEPERVLATDCTDLTWPLESWRISVGERVRLPLILIFYQRNKVGPYRLWRPADGHNVLLLNPRLPTARLDEQERNFFGLLGSACRAVFIRDLEELMTDFGWVRSQGPMGPTRADLPPPPRDPEWLATFQGASTVPEPDAEILEAALELRIGAERGERVAVEGVVAIPASAAKARRLGAGSVYNFTLNGDVVRDGETFESFRYRYDLPAEESTGDTLSVVFERYLRPGRYVLVIKLEDVHSGRVFHFERPVEVPSD